MYIQVNAYPSECLFVLTSCIFSERLIGRRIGFVQPRWTRVVAVVENLMRLSLKDVLSLSFKKFSFSFADIEKELFF